MPRRRSARISAIAAEDGPVASSAGNTVWGVAEIRQLILRWVPKASLPVVIRVQKSSMPDVARELYHTVDYERAKKHMNNTTSRQRMYCSLVQVINARKMPLSAAVIKSLEADPAIQSDGYTRKERIRDYSNRYYPEVFEIADRPLLRRFPNVRQILHDGLFANAQKKDSWVVHIHPPTTSEPPSPSSRASSSSLSPPPPDLGHVDYAEGFNFRKLTDLELDLGPLPVPPAGYTMTRRLDVSLYAGHSEADRPEEYLAALKEHTRFAHLHKSVHLGGVSATLTDIGDLYRRQIASAAKYRLAYIHAENCHIADLADLQTFASIACTSLVKLQLVTPGRGTYKPDKTVLGFGDIPALTRIIRSSLPNLLHLSIALAGIESAEADCAAQLSAHSLDDGGTLTKLEILAARQRVPVYNVLRALSGMCTGKANIYVDRGTTYYPCGDDDEQEDVWLWWAQKDYHSYLRSQSPARRQHLATMDFSTLDISTPAQVLALQYAEDGRPLSRTAGKVRAWKSAVQAVSKGLTRDFIPILTSGEAALVQAADGFEAAAGDGDTALLLAAAQSLQTGLLVIKVVGGLLQKLVDTKTERDIQDYINSLKRKLEDQKE